MKHLDLCTGIAGFSLAARWMNWETIGFSEIDPYCCKLLEQNFPGIKNYGDLRTADFYQLRGSVDLARNSGGEDPASSAGKRGGEADDRWLWQEALKVIECTAPRWIVLENVRGLTSLDDGMAFERILTGMEALGYEVQPIIIPACAVGALHRRDRVWIIANAISEPSDSRRTKSKRFERQTTTSARNNKSGPWVNSDTNSEHGRQGNEEQSIQFLRSEAKKRPGQITSNSEGFSERALRKRNKTRQPSTGNIHKNDLEWARVQEAKDRKKFEDSENDSDANRSRLEEREEQPAQQECPSAQRSHDAFSYTTGEGLPDWAGGTIQQPEPLTQFERSTGREVELHFCRVVTRLSNSLDDGEINGKTCKTNKQAVLNLWDSNEQVPLRESIGRLLDIHAKEILRVCVHGEIDDKSQSSKEHAPLASEKNQEEDFMPPLLRDYKFTSSSHGQKSKKQRSKKLESSLFELSHETSLESGKGLPISVYTAVKSRVSRLKALGNAIVPSVAFRIFQAIQKAEDSKII